MPDRKPATEDLREIARALNSGAIHLLRGTRRVDRESGLTPARLSALSVLVFGGPTPLGRLARVEGVTSPTMTRVVDGLESLGLATRGSHPDSSRIVVVSATAAGQELMRTAAERRVDVIVAALTELSETEQQTVRAAAPLIDRLAALVATRPVGS